jgi:hypothetical protein
MITKTTYPNGSVITEYQNHYSKRCGCDGSCNCISQIYPKYENDNHYILENQQPKTCVKHPINPCDCNNLSVQQVLPLYNTNPNFSFSQATQSPSHPQNNQTYYATSETSNQSIKNKTPYQQTHHFNAQTNTYNILPKSNNTYNLNKEADIYNPYTLNPFAINSYLQTGYPANLYQVPKLKDWALVQGDGIRFEEYETGLKLHNAGLKNLAISGISGSGVIVQNTGTSQEPKYIVGINTNEFAANNNLTQEINFNGKSYTPINGKIFINSGATGTPISKLNSLDNTISIIPTAVGEYNIQTSKISVKGVNTKTNSVDRKLVEFTDGLNTAAKLSNDNQVSFDVTGVVKTVNNQLPDNNGNVAVSVASQTIFYQFRKILTAGDITAFQTAGVDVISMTVNQGNKPTQLTNSDGVMIYINDKFLGLDKYTRSGNIITLGAINTINANDSLSIVVIKSI